VASSRPTSDSRADSRADSSGSGAAQDRTRPAACPTEATGPADSTTGSAAATDADRPAHPRPTGRFGAAAAADDLVAAIADTGRMVARTATRATDTVDRIVERRAGAARRPADLIDLTDWSLTLPTGAAGDPDTVENPDLQEFTNDYFTLNDTRDGVVFTARADGVTTKNSHYPRSELREMNGRTKAAWTNTSGTHTLEACQAITTVPRAKPEVVAAQIHDGSDDVLQIRLEGPKLMVQYDDGNSEAVLDPHYRLGTPYQLRIDAADSKIEVHYNDQKTAELPLKGSGWYWKVGSYVQSNTSKGDRADAVGAVTVYALQVNHNTGADPNTSDTDTDKDTDSDGTGDTTGEGEPAPHDGADSTPTRPHNCGVEGGPTGRAETRGDTGSIEPTGTSNAAVDDD
jgi:poly(beta-D-mannuronate) lyase